MRRILFISDYAPTESNSGGIVMSEQLAYLKNYAHVDILVYSSEMLEYEGLKTEKGEIYQRVKLGERQLGILSVRLKHFFESLFNKTVLRVWLKSEKRFLRKNILFENYSDIFITVQGLYLIKLLSNIEFKKNSVVLQYWDPDIWWAQQHNFTQNATNEILELHTLMERDKCVRAVLVPSEGMAEVVRLRSNLEFSKVLPFYPSERNFSGKVDPPAAFLQIRKAYSRIIVMAGAAYALPEIQKMIEALEEFNATNAGQEIHLVLIGPTGLSHGKRFFSKHVPDDSCVHLLGRLTVAEVDACLELADINFLPYPFWHRELVEESFPSKFSKYLGSGRNLLVAAPEYSSLTRLLRSYGLHEGLVTTLSKTNLIREMSHLLYESEYANSQLEKLCLIKEELFTSTAFSDRLQRVFHLDTELRVEQEVVTVKIPVKFNWVHLTNKFARDISFFLENLKNPGYLILIRIYQILYRLKVVSLVKSVIGERKFFELLKIVKTLRRV